MSPFRGQKISRVNSRVSTWRQLPTREIVASARIAIIGAFFITKIVFTQPRHTPDVDSSPDQGSLPETEPLARLLDLRVILVCFEEYIVAVEQHGHNNDNTQNYFYFDVDGRILSR